MHASRGKDDMGPMRMCHPNVEVPISCVVSCPGRTRAAVRIVSSGRERLSASRAPVHKFVGSIRPIQVRTAQPMARPMSSARTRRGRGDKPPEPPAGQSSESERRGGSCDDETREWLG